jgi:hypothetical protein
MGTNFYANHPDGMKLHIGNSSAGWVFMLSIYPELGINTLDDWKSIFCYPLALIEDEYGRFMTPAEMLNKITKRAWGSGTPYTQAYYLENGADKGPNGLLRSKVDGVHCIGHGEGTYDYIVGDFS